MVKIQVDLKKETNKKVKQYIAENDLDNKAIGVSHILDTFFNTEKKKGWFK